MSKLPPSSPISHKIVVSTIATVIGCYAFWQVAKDFQLVKFEPRLEEDVQKRKKEGLGIEMHQLDTRTLDYTPEAKKRLRARMTENNQKTQAETDSAETQ